MLACCGQPASTRLQGCVPQGESHAQGLARSALARNLRCQLRTDDWSVFWCAPFGELLFLHSRHVSCSRVQLHSCVSSTVSIYRI